MAKRSIIYIVTGAALLICIAALLFMGTRQKKEPGKGTALYVLSEYVNCS